MKKKTVTLTLLITLSITLLFMPLYVVSGQIGSMIDHIFPTSQAGKAGDIVYLAGSIDTVNGTYQIWFGNILVFSSTSIKHAVDATFTVPELPAANYTLTLRDVKTNSNATREFKVIEAYSIKAIVPAPPTQLQQGSTVTMNVTLTGGRPKTVYAANITVMLPVPLNTNYSRLIELSTTQAGTARAQVTYPDAAFLPSGSLTNFTGLYRVYFNLTQMLAEDKFLVGFTDASEYHREQSVAIRAIGYRAEENATITITYPKTGANVYSKTVTASSEGIISVNWAVPLNALIGDYNITITPLITPKRIVDSQLFTVPGYPIKIRTLNLAGNVVSQILVEALDQATNTLYNGTSGDDGIASVKLERGNHTISAFWSDVKVGEITISIIGESQYDLRCELINLKITVQDKNKNFVPFVSLDITYQYMTTKESALKTGSVLGQTNAAGAFTLNSTLPKISYNINASIYGIVFNTTTVSNIPVQPTFQVIILCPSRTLRLKMFDYKLVVIPNVRIEMVEQTSRIFYTAVTDDAGTVSIEVTFGKYQLRVYIDNILLNETVIEVFSDLQTEIRCLLYNLELSVMVVDYFEQPIPNVNVMLRGPEEITRSATTRTDGTATFDNLIGGTMQIIAYLSGREDSYEAVQLQVEAPTAIKIKMGKYILLGALLIEARLLATLILILAVVILFFSIEVYRKKRFKPSKSES